MTNAFNTIRRFIYMHYSYLEILGHNFSHVFHYYTVLIRSKCISLVLGLIA